jgi:metal transporter CNNM
MYDRARLTALLRVTQENINLNKDEVNILTGALVLQEKKVEDIMTPIGDCYMLKTISEIKDKGYSRIPVFKVPTKCL